jgi:signal transduction histidine kinase
VLAAMVVGVLMFFIISSLGSYIIRDKLESTDYIEQSIENKVNEFQSYVTSHNVSTTDIDSVESWVKKQHNVMLAIHDGNKVVFDSTFSWRKNHDSEDGPPPHSYRTLYSVDFADKTAHIEMFVLIEFKFMVIVNYIAIFIGVVVFLLTFTSFINHKVKYITSLEKEVNIIEGGNLDYSLTIKGNDELTYLASSIDSMRTSIIERQRDEEQTRQANHKLVTAMSHDLRTPLTILIGLLEIIDGKKYNTEDELNTYITKTKNKAYQIKELSDKIFEYLFAFDIKESELHKERYDIEVINTMIEDNTFGLGEKGFTLTYTPCEEDVSVMLDTTVFVRVFVNIFSNILKYADKEKPVTISSTVQDGYLVISASNYAIKKGYAEESTNIGLEVCKNIVQQHNGSFEHIEKDGIFTAVVKLPVVK